MRDVTWGTVCMNAQRLCIALLIIACSTPAGAADRLVIYPAVQPGGVVLSVASSTDSEAIAPLLEDYLQDKPTVGIRYHELKAEQIYVDVVAGRLRADTPDLLISSAMDLQTKLVNDGYALPHPIAKDVANAMPAWARWRSEIYGFSYEPIVLVYNTRLLKADQVPRTHKALLDMLLDPAQPLQGRIGTYDPAASSFGYLLATQDARLGDLSRALITALGINHAVLANETRALLDQMAIGRLALGYNLLGSYAFARIAQGAPLAIMPFDDYTLGITRTVLIPKTATHPGEAARFVDYLLSPRGQRVLIERTGFLPIRNDIPLPSIAKAYKAEHGTKMRPIPLGPGLLVYRDRWKEQDFMKDWRQAFENGPAPRPPEPSPTNVR